MKKLSISLIYLTMIMTFAPASASEQKEDKEKKVEKEKEKLPLEVEQAIFTNNIAVVKKYLDEGGDPNAQVQDFSYRSALNKAQSLSENDDRLEIITLLLDKGANFAELSLPLDVIATNKNFKIAELFIQHGANINEALVDAAKYGYAVDIIFLLGKGAKPTVKDEDNMTASDYLTNNEKTETKEKKEMNAQSLANKWVHSHVKSKEISDKSGSELLNYLYYMIKDYDAQIAALELCAKFIQEKSKDNFETYTHLVNVYQSIAEKLTPIIYDSPFRASSKNYQALEKSLEKLKQNEFDYYGQGIKTALKNRELYAAVYAALYPLVNRTSRIKLSSFGKEDTKGEPLPEPEEVMSRRFYTHGLNGNSQSSSSSSSSPTSSSQPTLTSSGGQAASSSSSSKKS